MDLLRNEIIFPLPMGLYHKNNCKGALCIIICDDRFGLFLLLALSSGLLFLRTDSLWKTQA